MKLAMKLTFSVFLASLLGMMVGGAWLKRASYRSVRGEAARTRRHILRRLGDVLAPLVREKDEAAIERLLVFTNEVLPVPGYLEVTDSEGTRIAAVGDRPGNASGIYVPINHEEHGLVGALQALTSPVGIGAIARSRQRPGGTAILVALTVAWILTEIMAAFVLLSPIQKLHRALLRVLRREGAVDLDLLREETRFRGKDEIDAIFSNTCAVIERAIGQPESEPEPEPKPEAPTSPLE